MAISLGGFSGGGGGGGASTDNLDDVTSRGATTTNTITVGGVTVGTEYSLPTLDGSANQVLQTNGTGTVSFATLDFTGGLEYKGAFNATAGTPSLLNAEKGDFYIIDTAGTIYGQTWAVGDHLLINEDMGGTITNSKIDKIDNTDTPASETVAGVIEIATNAEAEAGTATDKALVPSNISSIALSSFNDDLSYLSSGDNVSLLTNDANYVASGDNVSVLTNDANYVASGDNVSVLTNDAGYLTDITGESIGDLSDVTVTTPSNGQVLSYNGTAWVNSASSAGSLSGLSDTTIGTPTNGEVLKYNGAAWVDANVDYTEVTNTPTNVSTFTNDANYVASGDNVSVLTNDAGYLTSIPTASHSTAGILETATNAEATNATANDKIITPANLSHIDLSTFDNDSGFISDITSESLGDLSDVTVTTPSNGQVLSYNGTNWVNSASSAGSLSGLSDTTISTPVNGEVLKYNGTAWVDAQLAYSELSGTPTNVSTFTNDANYVASGDNVSVLTNDAGYLTDITSEGLNDLSDISFTAGVGIDGHVLTYDNTASEWQAVAPTSGGLTYAVVTLTNYNASRNTHAHYTSGSSNTWTVTLPAISTLSSGDVFVFSRAYNGSTVINKNSADSNCIVGLKTVSAVASVTIDSQPSVFYFIFDGTNFRQAQSALGSGAELNADNTANNLVKLDFQGRLPAIDGSQLSNLPYVPTEIRTSSGTSLTLSASLTNLVYWLIPTASATFTITLPLTSTLSDGDSWTIQRQTVGDLVIQQNGSDSGAKIRFGASDASSHTINAPGQSFLITYDSTSNKFYIFDQVFLQEISNDTTPQLGGDLDTNSNEIVTASNANLVLRPNGTGHVFLGGNTNPAELRLYCESADAHYVGFKSPTHAQLSGSQVWRLPVADATTSGDALVSDGAGNLSFTTISGGSGGYTYSAITADPANAQYDYHYSCTGTFTVTLPASAGADAGKEIRIKNMGTGTITVDGNASETIDSQTTIDLDVQYSSITLIATGNTPAAWEIV